MARMIDVKLCKIFEYEHIKTFRSSHTTMSKEDDHVCRTGRKLR